MVRRYELTDEQYALVKDLMPATGRPGGQWKDHRTTLDGIFWILHSGAQWRELPERYGNWKTVYDRFNRFRREGFRAAQLPSPGANPGPASERTQPPDVRPGKGRGGGVGGGVGVGRRGGSWRGAGCGRGR